MTAAEYVPLGVRLRTIALLVTVNTAIYLLINAHPPRPPVLLPITALDEALGRHAWTIWPYWLLLVLNPFLALAIRERAILLATLRAYLVAMGLNILIWLAWPTHILRDPLPSRLDPFTEGAWTLLYALDDATNCFPSGHITIPTIVLIGVAAQHPRARVWLWPVALLFPTIVTTGQHYAVDLFAGAATALIGIAIAGRTLFARLRAPAATQPTACPERV